MAVPQRNFSMFATNLDDVGRKDSIDSSNVKYYLGNTFRRILPGLPEQMNNKTSASLDPYLSGITTRFQNFEKIPSKTYFMENEFMKMNESPTYIPILPNSISQGPKQVPFENKTSLYGNDVPNKNIPTNPLIGVRPITKNSGY